jgi:alcohol dehydrogenase class IV
MRLEFATAHRIVFGPGTISELPALAAGFGTHALVVTGADPSRAKQHLRALESAGIACRYLNVPGEPSVDLIREGAKAARYANFVIGFGGGSALDAAKAIAAVAPNSGEPLDYLEVIGRAQPLENTPLPFIAVPTTAGTGAEVTRNAVLGSPDQRVKASIRSPLMLARLALVDPDLTLAVPPAVTAATGLDALTQLMEAFVCTRANAVSDLFCLEGLRRASKALPVVYLNGLDRAARAEMSFASLLSGLALANAGLGVIHGFAAPLGGLLNAPHGALCAAVLVHGTAANIRALRERAPADSALTRNPLHRYGQIAALLTQNAQAEPEDAITALAQLVGSLHIRSLREHGLTMAHMPAVVEKAAAASSMKANPILLTPAELTEVLERSL